MTNITEALENLLKYWKEQNLIKLDFENDKYEIESITITKRFIFPKVEKYTITKTQLTHKVE